MKKFVPWHVGFCAAVALFTSGCVTEKPHQPIPKTTKIGVVSLLGQSQFVLSENSAPSKVNAPGNKYQYAHPLPGEALDDKLTQDIVEHLKQEGYQNVQAISLPPNTNPVQALKNRPDLTMILVISPDDGKAPQKKLSLSNDETVFGYGLYFNDSPDKPETYAYLNYDISVYRAKDLDLVSNAFYSQKNELSGTHFVSNYHDRPTKTVAELNDWVHQNASSIIERQALETLNFSVA